MTKILVVLFVAKTIMQTLKTFCADYDLYLLLFGFALFLSDFCHIAIIIFLDGSYNENYSWKIILKGKRIDSNIRSHWKGKTSKKL